MHVAVNPGAYARLSVTDPGCGMDEATRARVFEVLFMTKEAGKGAGLVSTRKTSQPSISNNWKSCKAGP
jgi:C4-dicarboxylate-specific signal transduction histidine kinase